MAILTHKCPHCLTDSIALQIGFARTISGTNRAAVALLCPRCEEPSCAVLGKGASASIAVKDFSGHGVDVTDKGWAILKFWPLPPSPSIPDLLPPDAERAYLQAERNFPVEGNEEAAGTMYRKALDVGLKKIDPTLVGMLGPRIKKLAAAGKLTNDIAEWSDQIIRVLGNEATHDEDPISRPDLETLGSFTEMVLRYLFTLPEMVKQRRAAQGPDRPLAVGKP